MKKPKRPSPAVSREPAATKSAKSVFSPVPLIVFLVGAGLLVWLIVDSFRLPPPAPRTDGSPPAGPATTSATNAPKPVATAGVAQPLSEATRRKLLGRWQRTDAEYAIEIRLISDDGITEARYFNPFNQRSINVARSSVTAQDGQAAFFMELQDVGYPGSTYTLRYDEPNDQLVGIYFQAAMQQSYEVAFQRLRGD